MPRRNKVCALVVETLFCYATKTVATSLPWLHVHLADSAFQDSVVDIGTWAVTDA